MPLTIQFGFSRSGAVSGGEFPLPSHLNRRVAEERGWPDYVTPLDFNYIGELINENEILINGKGPAGLSIKGDHSEKNGIPACLLATEAPTARGESLTGQSPKTGGVSRSHLRGIRIS